MLSNPFSTSHVIVVISSLLILLSGCSTYTQHTETQDKPGLSSPSHKGDSASQDAPDAKGSDSKGQASGDMPTSPITDDEATDSQGPCVYESTKGIAEITEISPTLATFKFYPGDQYFSLSVEQLPREGAKVGQELKAIIRSPLAGPCEEIEFELMATVE